MSGTQQSLGDARAHIPDPNETDVHTCLQRVLRHSTNLLDSDDSFDGTGFSGPQTALRTRSPWCLMRSIKRRAQINSAARRPRPRKMVSHPGPGVTSITTPAASNVNPAMM